MPGHDVPERRGAAKHFLEVLREKLKDPEFRKIEGFPIGTDEDILALSDPPYYTACPNPFLADFVKHYGKPYDPGKPYSREPFAVDVSEGKTDPIYKAHSYHTKVPHLAIVPSILHYTEPGDVVLDGFCGSGMTGVAAQWCGSAPEAYRRRDRSASSRNKGMRQTAVGARGASCSTICHPRPPSSPPTTTCPSMSDEFAEAGKRILDEVEQEIGWMYRDAAHQDGQDQAGQRQIEYTVWSEVFTCPDCAGEVVFLDEALDEETQARQGYVPLSALRRESDQGQPGAGLRDAARSSDGKPWKRVKFRPSLIVVRCRRETLRESSRTHATWQFWNVSRQCRCRRKCRRTAFPSSRCTTARGSSQRASPTSTISSCPAPPRPWPRCGARRTPIPTPASGTCCCSSWSRRSGECRC